MSSILPLNSDELSLVFTRPEIDTNTFKSLRATCRGFKGLIDNPNKPILRSLCNRMRLLSGGPRTDAVLDSSATAGYLPWVSLLLNARGVERYHFHVLSQALKHGWTEIVDKLLPILCTQNVRTIRSCIVSLCCDYNVVLDFVLNNHRNILDFSHDELVEALKTIFHKRSVRMITALLSDEKIKPVIINPEFFRAHLKELLLFKMKIGIYGSPQDKLKLASSTPNSPEPELVATFFKNKEFFSLLNDSDLQTVLKIVVDNNLIDLALLVLNAMDPEKLPNHLETVLANCVYHYRGEEMITRVLNDENLLSKIAPADLKSVIERTQRILKFTTKQPLAALEQHLTK